MSRLMTLSGESVNLSIVNPDPAMAWGRTFPLVQPVASEFTGVNTGSTSLTDLGGSLYFQFSPPIANGMSLQEKNVPIAPYNIEMGFLFPQWTLVGVSEQNKAGFFWRDSVSGKLVTIETAEGGGGISIQCNKFSALGSFDAQYTSVIPTGGFAYFYFRAQDDGANRISSISADSQNWLDIFSVANNDYISPNKIGFFVMTNNVVQTSQMTLFHWKQS